MIDLPKTKYCQLDINNDWLTISLDNNKKKNALSATLIDEIIKVLDIAGQSKQIRGILIKGKNGIFCSGADLEELHHITYGKGNREELTTRMSIRIGELLETISNVPQITASVIDGPCIAGGFGMACATDIMITMDSSIFKLSETQLGLTPAQIAPYILNRVNYSQARLLMLLGDKIDGKIAHEIGLADYLVTSDTEIEKVIKKIKSKVDKCSPYALEITKKLLSSNQRIKVQEAADLFTECVNHPEGKEGLRSFFEKRKPFWTKIKNQP
tara:strand:+ start:629 stop:1438 length:810 start_codon:yes stop_codon:yes gene_type:complete